MFSKRNLWFMTLFSIIIVMAVYYISTPIQDEGMVSKEVNTGTNASNVEVASAISSLRVNRDESLENEVNGIKEILMDASSSTEEKSDAYEALKELNSNKGKEEAIEVLLKKNFNYDCFVKVDGTNVKVVVDTTSHSYDLANKIIKATQAEFEKNVYVTVTFGTK